MAWTWTYEKSDGTPVSADAATNEQFAQQADAESWIGEAFRALLDQGVDQVTLLEDGSAKYTMSLHPPE
ncbi:MAG TPA: hypothetical protein VGP37_06725 [Candidatus Nanopelagicales bacterium]|nr:hypothetical protein [Candidatus Nanopelagicales bacterium]